MCVGAKSSSLLQQGSQNWSQDPNLCCQELVDGGDEPGWFSEKVPNRLALTATKKAAFFMDVIMCFAPWECL